MTATLKLLTKLSLLTGIAVALAFGAKEASACTTCDWDTQSCLQYVNPDLYCLNYCVNVANCRYGDCRETIDECICAE